MNKYEAINAARALVIPQLAGKSLPDAWKLIEGHGLTSRIVRINGQAQMITADVKMDRINLTVENGTVTGAT